MVGTTGALAVASILAQTPDADQRVHWLNTNAISVTSIDPDDDDFTDLDLLRKAIGASRLVVLGEQSHGDGAVFFAKCRLIKFLHREMGFDVLAWESGMFDCREVDRALKNPDRSMDEIAGLGVFPIWTHSAQVRPTLEYVRSTLTTQLPIETCGFNHQFSSGAGAIWPQALIAFFDAADPNVLPADVRASLEAGLKFLGTQDADTIKATMDLWNRIPALMDEHKEALVKIHGDEEFTFMRRTADDAVVTLVSMLEFIEARSHPNAATNNSRDQRMGENLIWLANEKYKGRKIIAWMATMHAVHDVQHISFPANPGMYDGVVTCGGVAHKALGEAMYTIGFISAEGKAGNVWAKSYMTLPEPSDGSLEDVCLRTSKPFLLVDFNGLSAKHWLRQPLVSRPLGYAEMRAAWPDQMDAMFYIQTMFPSTREDALPSYARLRADQ
jgi:erythromycin esterase